MINNIRTIYLRFLPFLFILIHDPVLAQLSDDFSDANISDDPAWSGDLQDFIVNGDLQLQLNAQGAGNSFLSVACLFNEVMEWDIHIKLAFSPSSNNYAKIYLLSDQADLTGDLNGYFLQLGEAGSNDAIGLFRQTGSYLKSICSGTEGLIAGPTSMNYMIRRTENGEWTISVKPDEAWEYTLEATGSDTCDNSFNYFGIYCNYTSSNSTRFYFDDIYAGPFVIDTIPPDLTILKAISQNQLHLAFSEPMNSITSNEVTNYIVSDGIGHPLTALRDEHVPSWIDLTFSGIFQDGWMYELVIQNVTDLEGNAISPISITFAYFISHGFDVIINEIMADPEPSAGLPGIEYIELYNRNFYPLDLCDWTLEYGASQVVFPEATILPDSFLVITKGTELSNIASSIDLLSSSSSLSNTGTTITLRNSIGQVIHSVSYSDSWYKDDFKKDGGWSLELVDPGNPCSETGNWKVSTDLSGGTPGRTNSVRAVNPDTTLPAVYGLGITDYRNLTIAFTEKMDSLTLSDPQRYFIDHDIGYPVQTDPLQPGYLAVNLVLSEDLQPGIEYMLKINGTVSDCSGNLLETTVSRILGLPAIPGNMDVVINEILTDPKGDGSPFVEIYNRSKQILDLNEMVLASFDTITSSFVSIESIAEQSFLIYPGDYFVLTADPENIKETYLTPNPYNFIKMPSFPGYRIDRGTIVLGRKSDGLIIDKVTYSSDYHFELLNSTEGVSLERVSFSRSSDDRTNWHSASETSGFATPGYKNSQFNDYIPDGNPITVYPEVFSPDNDGDHDILIISYKLDEPGYVASISIYDSNGRLVCNLINNVLIGSEGMYSWDGTNAKGEVISVGIYIVLVEIFNLKGEVKTYKKVCVLSGRI